MRFTHEGLVHDSDVVELAVRAAGQVAAQNVSGASVRRGATSGNANYDPSSGRFAPKENKAPAKGAPVNPVVVNTSGLPQGVSQAEWDRRHDMVKLAARSVETFDDMAAANFLKGRVGDLAAVDVKQFQVDVLDQKLSDLTDLLAQQMDRGRTAVSIKAARSYPSRALGQLSPDQVLRLLSRLEARGFSKKQINKGVISKLPEDKKKIIGDSYKDTKKKDD